jgi:hypothetical protein
MNQTVRNVYELLGLYHLLLAYREDALAEHDFDRAVCLRDAADAFQRALPQLKAQMQAALDPAPEGPSAGPAAGPHPSP